MKKSDLAKLAQREVLEKKRCPHCNQNWDLKRYYINHAHFRLMRELDERKSKHTSELFPGEGKASPDLFMLVDLGLIKRVTTGYYCITIFGTRFLEGKMPAPVWVDRRGGEMVEHGPAHYISEFQDES